MRHAFDLTDETHDLGLSRSADGYRLHWRDQTFPFRLIAGEAGDWVLQDDAGAHHLRAAVDGDWVHVHLDGETYSLRFRHALERLAQINEGGGADDIKATMPGSLIKMEVAVGDAVSTGQTLLVMESMKMETTVVAPRDGVIAAVHFGAGQTFEKDSVLLSLEPEASE